MPTATFGARVGDVVLPQFIREWQTLLQQLHHLEMQKGAASAGVKDSALMDAIEQRVLALEARFKRDHDAFQLLFSGDWSGNGELRQLQELIREVRDIILKILKGGRPSDGGEGSFVESAEEVRKIAKPEVMSKAGTAVNQPMVTLPQLPASAASNPMLAVALILDVIVRVVLRRRKRS